MKCTINGKEFELNNSLTLLALIESRDIKPERVVVELNGNVLTQADFTQKLKDGDSLEILSFVGGGINE